ncbi:MAG: efflux RND transporter permease subunit [Omnitrophica bacterium]|nr:efflux RND transporter permease subunit [Candidatus Omnitrophota bacterium]
MRISEFSTKNSLFINLLSVFFIIVGVIGVFNLTKEVFPNIPFDVAMVTTPYPGATAEDVEKLVTTPIEKELKEVDDIEEIRSTSGNNISTIYIKMNPDAKDKNKIINDIQRAVDKTEGLPVEADDTIVNEVNMKLMPIIEVAISGEADEAVLQKHAESLESILLNIPEVARISRKGWRDREIWVEVDPVKMREYYISFEEIMLALRANNLNMPAGTMRGKETEYIVRTMGEFLTKKDVEETVVRANDIGNWLKIKDVARVVDAFRDENEIIRSFGTRAINLVIFKKEREDAIELTAKVKNSVESFKKGAPENLKIYTLDDMSFYIKRRLNILKNNGIIGIILVLIALQTFLTKRVAFFTALGIPIAFSITLGFMLLTGMSINMMSMFGLIIVLGMIVDDGIIIAENTYRHIESGMPPREAAIKGAEEVIPAVATTIITTIVAFLPLAFMTGIIGRFVKSIPIIVIAALFASAFEAFVILPSHLADFARAKQKVPKNGTGKIELSWFERLLRFYTNVIKKAIAHRYKTIGIFVLGVIVLVVCLGSFLKVVAFPQKGIEEFYLRAEAPVGTSLDKTAKLSRQLEELIEETMPKNELDSYVTTVGNIFEGRALDPYARRGSHLVQINVYLTPEAERKRDSSQIIDSMRDEAEKIEGFDKVYFEQIREGPPTGRAVDIKIKGDDYTVLNEIGQKFTSFLKSIKGVTDIDTDYKFGKEEIAVEIDEKKASAAYLTVRDVANAVRSAVGGGIATSIKQVKAEEEVNVLVRFPENYRADISVFQNIFIPNAAGKLINLRDVATFKKQRKLESYKHLDGRRALRVMASVDEKNMTSIAANALVRKEFKNIEKDHLGYTATYGGEEKDTQESFGNLIKAFLLALLLIFLILATKFNSLVQPVIIMLAIVFGVFGALLALLLHGVAFSFMAFLGMVGLIGVVVNDSIVLVDFINKLRLQGKDRRESIIEAGRIRLRPVILTTITTVFGLAPVAYGLGGFDPFLAPAALVLAWGLLFATILTLIFIPCVYAVVDDITIRIAHHATVRRNRRNGTG